MKFDLPKIYPITDVQVTRLPHAEQVRRLIKGGAEIIQLRDKDSEPGQFCEQARLAIEIAREHGVRIIINDRVDLALILKADGVHLGQDDLPPSAARKILGEKAIIGFSTHSVEQAAEAAKFPVDYLAIGPIFATKTKKNPEKTVGPEVLSQVRLQIGDIPLVAIGGITRENFRELLECGADSVAVISGILTPSDDIVENIRMFLGNAR